MAKGIFYKLLNEVDSIKQVYNDFRHALDATLVMHLHSIESTMLEPQTYFRLHADDIHKRFSMLIAKSISDTIKNVTVLATGAEAERSMYVDHAESVYELLFGKIQSQMQSDVHQMAQKLQNLLMKVELRHRSEQLSRSHILISEREKLLAEMNTHKRDTLGRKRNALDYVALEINGTIFRLYNTLKAALLIINGEFEATLQMADGKAKTFALDTYEEIMQGIHPRMVAIIV